MSATTCPVPFPPPTSRFLPGNGWRRAAGWLLAIIAILGGSILFIRWPAIVLYWQQATSDAAQRERAVWLPAYRVDIEALPLAGVGDDLSGLTFDPVRRTLFAITNSRPEIIELSLDGTVLRQIPLRGVVDPEAIEYIAPGRFVVTDERRQALIEVRIDDEPGAVNVATGEEFVFGIGRNGNKGFEGLAHDPVGRRLFVAKERDPQRIYEIRGFPFSSLAPLAIDEHPGRDAALPGRDLSGLHFDVASGHLLALSEQSRLLVEFDADGRPVSGLSLAAGRNGLHEAVPQAEGVTLDDRGNLYLVSEPNLFYRFIRDSGAAPAD